MTNVNGADTDSKLKGIAGVVNASLDSHQYDDD